LDTAIFFEEIGSSREIARAEHRVADPADVTFCRNVHGALGHILRGPKFILIAVGIGKED